MKNVIDLYLERVKVTIHYFVFGRALAVRYKFGIIRTNY